MMILLNDRLVETVLLNSLMLILIFWLPRLAHSSCNVEQTTCGDVLIPYPFSLNGSSNGPCEYPPAFTLECRPNSSLGSSHYPYYYSTRGLAFYQLLVISYDSFILNVSDFKAIQQLNSSNSSQCGPAINASIMLPSYPVPFTFSADNQFGLFNSGCRTWGTFSSNFNDYTYEYEEDYVIDGSSFQYGGCVSSHCGNNVSGAHTQFHKIPNCEDKKCCVTPMTGNARTLFYQIDGTGNDAPCDGYSIPFYPASNFSDVPFTFPVKVLWALPYNTSNDAGTIEKDPLHACSEYSNITYQPAIPGYVCACLPGFEGDGYSNGTGCTDIDECSRHENRCNRHVGICKNTLGSYTCSCKIGYTGDGSSCAISTVLVVFTSAIGAFGIIGVLAVLLVVVWRRRQKRMNFLQNGGLELQEFFSSSRGIRDTSSPRVFSVFELKTATQNFSNDLKLGAGGHGSVFKGTLKDGRVVAVKKGIDRPGRDQKVISDQFWNEVRILTQINHRHIVRVLGCCLETPSPLLVYEFVPNGTLFDHLQQSGAEGTSLDWPKRLQVATEVTEALAYLHSATSPPILHRDVKSSNILLDDKMEAKVADFGISRMVPEGATHVSTVVQGTRGYLDPEYFQTLQLTDKSDVYGVGVVLAELITGLKPVDVARKPEFVNLAVLFTCKMMELQDGCGNMEDIMDIRLLIRPHCLRRRSVDEVHLIIDSMHHVGQLALRCLALHANYRPDMRHVAHELRRIRFASYAPHSNLADPSFYGPRWHSYHDDDDDYDKVTEDNEKQPMNVLTNSLNFKGSILSTGR